MQKSQKVLHIVGEIWENIDFFGGDFCPNSGTIGSNASIYREIFQFFWPIMVILILKGSTNTQDSSSSPFPKVEFFFSSKRTYIKHIFDLFNR